MYKYDDISLREWADKKGVNKAFYDVIMDPAISVTLNSKDMRYLFPWIE